MVDALKLCVCSLRPELGKPARRVRQWSRTDAFQNARCCSEDGRGDKKPTVERFFWRAPHGFQAGVADQGFERAVGARGLTWFSCASPRGLHATSRQRTHPPTFHCEF
jgi:hypothetical protein